MSISAEDTFVALLKESRARSNAPTLDMTSDSQASPTSDAIPAGLQDHPRYKIVGLIGKGGMGQVYQAEHRLMERSVALKLIHHSLVSVPEAIRALSS